MSTWVTLLCLLLFYTVRSEECSFPTFYIEHKTVAEGRNIATFPTQSLDECAKKCNEAFECTAANFLLNSEDTSICHLVNGAEQGSNSLTPRANTVIYALQKFCASKSSACPRREWSYEKHAGYEVKDSGFILGTLHDLELSQCLNSCTRLNLCESALYNPKTKLCRLSKVTLNNVNSVKQYFAYSDDVDLYETNCIKRRFDLHSCGFIRLGQAGFVDMFDVRLANVKSVQKCEIICLDWRFGTCRSYTYNKVTKQCYINHATQRSSGKSVLENLDKNLVSGEIDDCVNFELDCRGKSVILHGTSLRMFKGTISTRKGRESICKQNVSESYSFQAHFPFADCGMEDKTQSKTFTGLLMVKEGSTDLITVHDKMIEIKCKIHNANFDPQHNELGFQFVIGEPNSTFLLTDKDKPGMFEPIDEEAQFRLTVLDQNGNPAEIVEPGDVGYLLIILEDMVHPNSTFIVSDLVAEDEVNVVPLIDSKGCVIESKLIQSLERPFKNQLKIGIRFGGFPEQSQVTYHTLGKICHSGCDMECNKPFYKTDQNKTSEATLKPREKRQIGSENRKLMLHEDVYDITSQKPIRIFRRDLLPNARAKMDDRLEELMKREELTEIVEELDRKKSQSVSKNKLYPDDVVNQCLKGDWNCIFAISMAVIQFILMISCSCIVYTYAKKWIRYYRNRNRRMSERLDENVEDTPSVSEQSSYTAPSSRPTATTTLSQNSTKKF